MRHDQFVRRSAKSHHNDFEYGMDANLWTAINTMQRALPLMQPGSSITFNGSIAAKRYYPGHLLYSISKGALELVVRHAVNDLREDGIRCNGIRTGQINTDTMKKTLTPEERKEHEAQIPGKKMGDPIHIAKTACFLTDNEFVNGEVFDVDGGLTST